MPLKLPRSPRPSPSCLVVWLCRRDLFFNFSGPFEIHDDSEILRRLGFQNVRSRAFCVWGDGFPTCLCLVQVTRAEAETLVAPDVLALLPKNFPQHTGGYDVPPDSILIGPDATSTGVGAIAAASTAEATAIATGAREREKAKSPAAGKAKTLKKGRSTPTRAAAAAAAVAATVADDVDAAENGDVDVDAPAADDDDATGNKRRKVDGDVAPGPIAESDEEADGVAAAVRFTHGLLDETSRIGAIVNAAATTAECTCFSTCVCFA